MTDTFVLTGLVRKRAELAGDIRRTQADLQRMIRDLENLDATIRLFDADYQVEAIKPKAFRPPDDWANRGEMTRIMSEHAPAGRRTAHNARHRRPADDERALDTGNIKLVRLMTKRCGVALRGQRDKGVVRPNRGRGSTWFGRSRAITSGRCLTNITTHA